MTGNGRVLVLCASRDRNFALQRMIDSALATSTKVDMRVYVDEDQAEDYRYVEVPWIIGPRIGPVASLNRLWELNPGYEAYGAATDDCAFVTKGWDDWVLETVKTFPNQVGLISPHWTHRMDFPFATGPWTNALGWFAYPGAYHYYWDVLLEVVGVQASSIVRAKPEQFSMTHDDFRDKDLREKIRKDALAVIRGIGFDTPEFVAKIKQAQA